MIRILLFGTESRLSLVECRPPVRSRVTLERMITESSRREPLGPPRFSLRMLLLLMGTVGVLSGLSWWLSPIGLAAVTLAVLLVAVHVLGNFVGTRLRDGEESVRPQSERRTVEQHEFAPTTHLSGKTSLGLVAYLPPITGALLGMIGGCWAMRRVYGDHLDATAFALTAVAFGTLGGLAFFLLAAFLQTAAAAIRQAMRHK